MNGRALLATLLVGLGPVVTAAQTTPPAAGDVWTTDALVAHALPNHPVIAAAAAAVQGAEGGAHQAGLWPNPRVDYSAENLRSAGGRPRAEHTFWIEQPIPLGGRLRLGREAFTHAVQGTTASAEAARAVVANTVRFTAIEVRRTEAVAALAQRLAAYAEQAEDIARQLFNTGLVDQPDVLRAEGEAEAMRVRLAIAGTDRERAWRQLALAVNDPALPRRPIAAEAPPSLDRDAALAAIVASHPLLSAARAEVARSHAAASQVRADRVPDLVISGGPRYSSEPAGVGGDAIGWEPVVGVGLTVPLWNRNQGSVATSAAVEYGAVAALATRDLAIRTRFEDVWQRYTAASLAARAYGAVIVPKAVAAYEMSLARYREMALAYPLVLTAQRALLEASDAEIAAVADAARAAVLLQGFLLGEGEM